MPTDEQWKAAADEIETLRASLAHMAAHTVDAGTADRQREALERIAFCGAGEDYRVLREIARNAISTDAP